MKRTTFLSAFALAAFAAALPANAEKLPPTGLRVDAVTSSGATISWSAPASDETIVKYAYNVSLYNVPNGSYTTVPADTRSATVAGLRSNEHYYFHIRAIYEPNAQSGYASIDFFTDSAPVLPYWTGFEPDDVANWKFRGGSRTQSASRSGEWGVEFKPGESGPLYVVSPPFADLPAATVSFFYRSSNAATNLHETFRVGWSASYSSNPGWGDFTWNEWTTVGDALWTEYATTVPAGARYVAIDFDPESTGVLHVDEFLLDEHSSWAPPTGVAVGEVTRNGATLSWTSPDESVTDFVWQSRAGEGDIWSYGTSVSGTSAALTGLAENTTYSFRVKAVHPGGGSSDWTLPVSFTTEGAPIVPSCSEGFEGGLGGWRVVNPPLFELEASEVSADKPRTGGRGFRFAKNRFDPAPELLVSPRIECDGPSTVSFWYANVFGDDTGTDYPTYFQVGYSTTTKDASAFRWMKQGLARWGHWRQISMDLPPGVRYVAVKWMNDNVAFYLDDFEFAKSVDLPEGEDNGPTVAALADEPATAVLLDRVLRHDGSWFTLALPFSVPNLRGTPLEQARVQELVSASCEDGTLTLDFADAGSIEAGKPYAVKFTNYIARVIRTTADWNAFADAVDDGNDFEGEIVVLGANVGSEDDPIVRPVGHPCVPGMANPHLAREFRGTFDGRDHALYVWMNGVRSGAARRPGLAPFSSIRNATICNVRAYGLVAGGDGSSGLVGWASGTNLIRNCLVNVGVWFLPKDDESEFRSGSLVGNGGTSDTTVRNCRLLHGYYQALYRENSHVGAIYAGGEAGGRHAVENCVADLHPAFHPGDVGSFDWVEADAGADVAVVNCYRHDPVGTRAEYVDPEDAEAMERCLENLGEDWYLDRQGRLMPVSRVEEPFANYSVADPAFRNVTFRTGTEDFSSDVLDFVGNYAPVGVAGGDRTTLLLDADGRLSWTPDDTTLNAFRGRFLLKGLTAGNTAKAWVMHLAGKTFAGRFAASGAVDVELAEDRDNRALVESLEGRLANATLRGRTLYRDGRWTTLSLPFDLPDFAWTPLEGATAKALVSSSFADGGLSLRFEDAAGIEAGRPYAVRWPGPDVRIDSGADWDAFAAAVAAGEDCAGKVVMLTANVTVSKGVGTAEHPFRGTFEGAGRTLNLAIGGGEDFAAPFRFVENATIRDVVADGSVSGGDCAAGLVGRASGTNLVRDCWVRASVAGGERAGGVVGSGGTSRTTIRSCYVSGGISGSRIGVFLARGEAGGSYLAENSWAAGSYSYNLTSGGCDLLLADGGSGAVSNCFKNRDFGTQGDYVFAFGYGLVRGVLGSQWGGDDRRLALAPSDLAAMVDDPIENPRFCDVVLSSATRDEETGCVDFVGNAAPTVVFGGDRGTLLLRDDGSAFAPVSDTALNAYRGRFLLKGALAGWEAKRCVLDFGGRVAEGSLENGGNEVFDLFDDADNAKAIAFAQGKRADVTLRGRTLRRDGTWNTLALPFDVPSLADTPLDGASVKTLVSSAFADGGVSAVFADAAGVEAGRPCVVRWPEPDLEIATSADWDGFAARVAGGESFAFRTVRLAADVAVSTPVGTAEHPFRGTFDGAGHELALGIADGGDGAAPFRFVENATIRHVKTTGSVSGGDFAAGLVGCAAGGTNRIRDCWAAASVNGAEHAGGIVGNGGPSKTVVRNCFFDGAVSARSVGAFVGWGEAGGTSAAETCWANGSYAYTAAFDLVLPGGGSESVSNCRKNSRFGTQGEEDLLISLEQSLDSNIRWFLGASWSLDGDGRLCLAPPALADLENPVFRDVTVDGSSADDATGVADFVGNFSPVEPDGLGDLLFGADGSLARPASGEVLRSCRGRLRLKGVVPGVGADRYALDFGNWTVEGLFAEPTAYERWAAANGVDGGWTKRDASGVHNVFRYAFDVPRGAFDPPLLSISFDADGRPVVVTPPPVPGIEDFDFELLACDSPDGAPSAVFDLAPSGTNAIPGEVKSARFFRLRATER